MNAAQASLTTDHVCAWAAASPGEVPGVEFLEGGVDVVEIEDHGVVHQVVVADPCHREIFDCDRSVGVVGIAEYAAGEPEARSPYCDRLHLQPPTLGRVEYGLPDVARYSLVVQTLSAVLISSVRGGESKCTVDVAAVEGIRETRPGSACGVFKLQRRPTELVEPHERGVEVLPRRRFRNG